MPFTPLSYESAILGARNFFKKESKRRKNYKNAPTEHNEYKKAFFPSS